MITFLQSEQSALRTEPTAEQYHTTIERLIQNPKLIRLVHVVLGLITEIGETADPLKKHLFYGKPLDEKNIAEELGDLSWYLRVGCETIYGGGGFERIVEENVTKLRERFPNSFTEADAIARADKLSGE